MPIFLYECKECSHVEDEIVKFDERETKKFDCPKCNKEQSMEYKFNPEPEFSFDVIGGYEYKYGKKAWKKKMNNAQKADVLLGNKDPY